jgi:hypothetical protein
MQETPGATLHVAEAIAIDTLAAEVWMRIRSFDALADWHPAVAASPADRANAAGSVRRLRLHGGGELVETLDKHDDAHMSYSYRADDGGALPVVGYRSTIHVSPEGAGATVSWQGDFGAAPGVEPEAAAEAIRGVYRAGLERLRGLCERAETPPAG